MLVVVRGSATVTVLGVGATVSSGAAVSTDSIEQLLTRIRDKQLGGPALARAAEIYARTRYGFTVGPGDPLMMRQHALDAGKELRANLSGWDRVRNLWRGLS